MGIEPARLESNHPLLATQLGKEGFNSPLLFKETIFLLGHNFKLTEKFQEYYKYLYTCVQTDLL